MQPINRIVTHTAPHLDEIFAIWLLRRFGKSEFPGVSTAPVEYWKTGMEKRTWQEHHDSGTLLLGVGGGRFDEHPRAGKERKEGQASASLVATALGVINEPALRSLLRYVVDNDLRGGSNPFDLATLVVLLHRRYPHDPDFVINWTLEAITARYEQQAEFLNATREEYQESAAVTNFRGPNGRKLKIVAINSDNLQIPAFARSKLGGYAAVVIVRNSQGNTSIFTNKFYNLRLTDVARMVRWEEQLLRPAGPITRNWRELEAEGTVAGAEEWFYFKEGEMLLNGSPTHPDVPPTKLPLERLTELVQVALSPRDFEPTREAQCRAGICTNAPASPCPWYAWGLSRCRKVRFVMAKSQSGNK